MPLEDIRQDRLKKSERYRAEGLDPYPASTKRSAALAGIVKNFSSWKRSKKSLSLAGRLTALREHGGVTFADLIDQSGKIQVSFNQEALGSKPYALVSQTLDIGDFIEVSGKAFKTQSGEPTILASSFRLLAKTLRPLPEKWHGLKDVEERFRRRYLDLIMNPEVRGRFEFRSKLISSIRTFFDSQSFLEVETPMLQDLAGGAMARPFRTHHNALDTDLYLRIAPELYLKELLIGGMEKIYELAKSFRNEGIDSEHNPEFTSIEWYAAYWDEEDMMECVEKLFGFLLKALKLKKTVSFDGKTIVFDKKFARIEFNEILRRHALILDYERETRHSMAVRARQFGIESSPNETKGKIADAIFKKICRPHLIQPTFVTHQPIEISPLAKRRVPSSPIARRFQLIIAGLELVNAFSELNDPLEQRLRFEEEKKLRLTGDEESHPFDEEFVEALEYGMPPAAGAGLGIDRLVMLLADTKNIREVVLFPTLRPK